MLLTTVPTDVNCGVVGISYLLYSILSPSARVKVARVDSQSLTLHVQGRS